TPRRSRARCCDSSASRVCASGSWRPPPSRCRGCPGSGRRVRLERYSPRRPPCEGPGPDRRPSRGTRRDRRRRAGGSGAVGSPARAAHRLERDYVLAVGTLIARKNLSALELTERRLAEEGIELVTAGSGRGYMRADERAPGRAIGYVRDDHLPGLYAGALALV